MKKVLILYDTIFGNTKNIAMALSRGLEAGNLYVDCIFIQDFDINEMREYDVIGIGGPTHFHKVSKLMKSFLKNIKHLVLENKYWFVFETKGDFHFAGSAARSIIKSLRKMKLEIIDFPPITGIVLEKEGPLQENTLEELEQIGLNLSEKINDSSRILNTFQKNKASLILIILKWILIGGGPIFFFIRALYLASSGGDCFGTLNPGCSWFLLILEIVISGTTGMMGIVRLLLIKSEKKCLIIIGKFRLKDILLFMGIASYSIHFVRVGIWLALCVF